jgi:signal transduction histidine kinase
LLQHCNFQHVEIVRDYVPDLESVICNQTALEQVFLNLIKNAAQAMADAATPLPHRIVLRTRREKHYVRIEVEDNGPGIDEQTRRHIFEPFFTTKPAGKGTGLGLSVSYFIITQQHDGRISVISTPRKGTCFIIHLPLHGHSSPA